MRKQSTLFAPASIVLAFVFAFIFAYWSALLIQQDEVVEDHALLVRSNADGVDIVAGLSAIAEQHSGRLAVAIPQPESLDVYAAGAYTPRTYRRFPPAQELNLYSLSELPYGEARWMYQLSGPGSFREAVEAYLSENGVNSAAIPNTRWEFLLVDTSLGSLLLLVMAVCAAIVVASTLARSKDYAIWQLHGLSFGRTVTRELRRSYCKAFIVSTVVAIAANTVGGLLISWHAMRGLLRYELVFLFLIVGAMAVAFLVALAVVMRLGIPDRLKGKLPVVSTSLLALLTQTAAILSVASFAVPAFNTVPQYMKQSADTQVWAATEDVVVADLSSARDLEGVKQSERDLAAIIREFSANHEVVLADYWDENAALSQGIDKPTVMFNQTAAARSIQPELESADHPVLYIPPDMNVSVETLTSLHEGCSTYCEVRELQPGHEVFTWNVFESGWMEPAIVHDPIIMIYPDDQLASDRTIVAAMSRKRLGFTTSEFLTRIDQQPDLATFVAGATNMSSLWAQAQGAIGREALMFVGGLLVAVVFALGVAVVVAFIYRRLWHQRLRVMSAFGRAPIGVYTRMAGITFATLAAVFGYFWNKTSLLRQWEMQPPGAASPIMLAIERVSTESIITTLVVALCAFGLSLATVSRPNRSAAHADLREKEHDGISSARS